MMSLLGGLRLIDTLKVENLILKGIFRGLECCWAGCGGFFRGLVCSRVSFDPIFFFKSNFMRIFA